MGAFLDLTLEMPSGRGGAVLLLLSVREMLITGDAVNASQAHSVCGQSWGLEIPSAISTWGLGWGLAGDVLWV